MSNMIIAEPTVSVAATSKLDLDYLKEAIEGLDLTEIADDTTTPLGKIVNAIGSDNRDFTDAEFIPEFGGRFCYNSWEKGRPTDVYNRNILEMQHGSVLEHVTISFVVSGVSRALSLELIRHRVGTAISQESQRYVDAADINFVMPPLLLHFLEGDVDCEEAKQWLDENKSALASYETWQTWLRMSLQTGLSEGSIPIDADIDALGIPLEDKQNKQFTRLSKRANEAARSQLPNAAETKFLWTVNLRTLRHFIMLRGDDPADLEIRRFAVEVAELCKEIAPSIFSDILIVPGSFGVPCVTGTYLKV